MTRRADIAYFPLGAAAFGGAERSLLELATSQRCMGRRVVVCYERALDGTDFIDQARARELTLVRVDWSPEDSGTAVFAAALTFFRALDVRLMHFNISWRRHMWLVPLVARLCNSARLVGTMRALPEPYENIPRRTLFGCWPMPRLWAVPDHLVARCWAWSMHRTVSVNRNDYPPRLAKEFGFSLERLSVIYNGVAIPVRAPDASERLAAKVALGVSPDRFLVAYVGRISEEKGVRYLLDAMSTVDERAELVIAGDGPELSVLRQRASALGLGARIRFLGYTNDPLAVFRAADVAVIPSLWNEAFGRVVVEAMACATPVVATSVGGMRELFDDDVEGLFVPKADSRRLAVAINQLVADARLWRRLSTAGRRLAEDRYATTRVAAEYEALYRVCLSGETPPY